MATPTSTPNESTMEPPMETAQQTFVMETTSSFFRLGTPTSGAASAPVEEPSYTLPVTTSPSYVSQFSMATSSILSRIKTESRVLNSTLPDASSSTTQPDGGVAENAKTKLDQSMDTTLTMPMPSPAHSQRPFSHGFISHLQSPHSSLLGLKRKRDSEAEKVDFTQNTMSFPPPPPTPRLYAQPATGNQSKTYDTYDVVKKCLKCDESIWARLNLLVTCTRCSGSWHQRCADPVIPDEIAKSSGFRCSECAAPEVKREGSEMLFKPQKHSAIEKMRQKQLSALPKGVSPAKPELVGFPAGQASDFARTEYFYGKKRTDLLNVLSFCSQLRPQLLVDVLVSVSKRHPNLPMFDSPDWQTRVSSSAAKSRAAHQNARGLKRPRHGHSIINSKLRGKAKGRRKMVKDAAGVDTGEEEVLAEEADVMPPTWPKAGEGLYAKLLPEDEDRAFLADDNDEEAFSHFMVDKLGRQMTVPAVA